jgi:D-alanyl-D-alanine carboxypeptidase
MEWGFANFARLNVVDAGEPLSVEVKVADGASETVRPIAADHVSYIVRKGQAQDLHVTFQIPSVISAPIAKHQALGEVVVRDRDQVVGVVPAVSPIDINRAERGAYMH